MLFHTFNPPPQVELPTRFTYPFCYEPHPLAIIASQHLIGLLDEIDVFRRMGTGKMFGVLVVKSEEKLGFLMAYSGNISREIIEKNAILRTDFVPQIYTLPEHSIPTNAEESRQLQDFIFSQYRMLNAKGESRDLLEIFSDTPLKYPPSGSGDCCAPKLLQYAFANNMQPVCMAEFWYGNSPSDEIRHHLVYYPSCQGRCKPILSWMLEGMAVDSNPMEEYPDEMGKKLKVVYEDDWMIIVNKPSGMLSVPGKIKAPCVADVLRKREEYSSMDFFPVHRLDMFTSGLQILVKGLETQKEVRRMFENRQVKKQYVALLDGILPSDSGRISLPLSSDYLNRPCQRVDFEHGKTAITDYEVVERRQGRTLVRLFPHTGRTHQLRIHCASKHGLGCPIVGDELYGRKEKGLCLHAQSLEFVHPVTNETIKLSVPYSFS